MGHSIIVLFEIFFTGSSPGVSFIKHFGRNVDFPKLRNSKRYTLKLYIAFKMVHFLLFHQGVILIFLARFPPKKFYNIELLKCFGNFVASFSQRDWSLVVFCICNYPILRQIHPRLAPLKLVFEVSLSLCFLNGRFPASFSLFSSFQCSWQNNKYVRYKSFANDWIWTADLWCRKRLLYQLSHNNCPPQLVFFGHFFKTIRGRHT